MQLYEDVYLRRAGEQIKFGNADLELRFDADEGTWSALGIDQLSETILKPTEGTLGVDVQVDDEWLVSTRGARFTDHSWSIDRDRTSVSFALHFDVTDQNDVEYRLTSEYTLRTEVARIDRSAEFRVLDDEGEDGTLRKFQGFEFVLPAVGIGAPEECVVDAPGSWSPDRFVPPETPISNLDAESTLPSAPDGSFGFVAVTNPERDVSVGTWMDTGIEVNYRPTIYGVDRPSIEFLNERQYLLSPSQRVNSDIHCIEVGTSLPELLDRYREIAAETMSPVSHPDWLEEMTLLEVYPEYYENGFVEIAERLPFYREIGFDTIYLMPHWRGGYSPIDPYEVDPEFGTEADLIALVETAHDLDMRFLFDMVIHGFDTESPIIEERPDLFVRDEDGEIARHRAWNTASTDWGSEAYQEYMADLARHHVNTYDIDGYRVDAASYKGPEWNPDTPRPAYRSGTAAPEVMKRIRDALQAEKSDAVLVNEVFGPGFYTVADAAHDNHTGAPQYFLELLDEGVVDVHDYEAHLANVRTLLPADTPRVFYTRNHDTSWFYHFNGYTPRFRALEAIHALCAIPEAFAGDPQNPPHPEDAGIYDFYSKVFKVRNKYPELERGNRLIRDVTSDDPMVFSALCQFRGQRSLVVVSLREELTTVTIRLDTACARFERTFALYDPIREKQESVTVESSTALEVSLEPCQILVGRL